MITSLGLPYFGQGNGKLPDSTLTFSLPSGWTCPGACSCLARADRTTGQIMDGPEQIFRCHEASIEALRPAARTSRWRNYDLLKQVSASAAAELLLAGIAATRSYKTTHVRWFTGGDLCARHLLEGILSCAEATPDLTHYFYTKNLPLVAPGGTLIAAPANLRITASWGGLFDQMIRAGVFPRTARVLHNEEQASRYGLPVDYNDRMAWQDTPSHFCHLVHGAQRKGSSAGEAIRARRRNGEFSGYGRKARGHG